jgi:hypothetical protein
VHSAFRRLGRMYWQCSACRSQCSVTPGTIFESSKLRLLTWFLAMHLLTQSKNFISALELKGHLGVCYKTAWLVKHKLMEVMRLREEDRQLTGRVEVDDAYLGGERSGGKAGRGSENKVPFIAALQTTEDGQAVLACLRPMPFTTQAMTDFAARSLVRPLTVVSDGLARFLASENAGVHERIVTGGGKAASKLPQFKAVNTGLSNLKTGLTGTYHAFKFAKYAHQYLAEFQTSILKPRFFTVSSISPERSWPPERQCSWSSPTIAVTRLPSNQRRPSSREWLTWDPLPPLWGNVYPPCRHRPLWRGPQARIDAEQTTARR